MRVAIAGAGAVGRSIALELVENSHQVMLIERELSNVQPEAVEAARIGFLRVQTAYETLVA